MISRLFLLCLLVMPYASTAQVLLKLSVADETTGEPVPYASMVVKESKVGARSDASGKFILHLKKINPDAKIVISAIGYETRELSASEITGQQLMLSREIRELKAVEITCYRSNCGRGNGESMIGVTVGGDSINRDVEIVQYLTGELHCIAVGISIKKENPVKTTNTFTQINTIKAYPNPVIAGNSIQAAIQLQEPNDCHIDLVDAMGRVVWVKKLQIRTTHYNFSIPTSANLSAGIYWLRISGKQSQKIFCGKVLIQ